MFPLPQSATMLYYRIEVSMFLSLPQIIINIISSPFAPSHAHKVPLYFRQLNFVICYWHMLQLVITSTFSRWYFIFSERWLAPPKAGRSVARHVELRIATFLSLFCLGRRDGENASHLGMTLLLLLPGAVVWAATYHVSSKRLILILLIRAYHYRAFQCHNKRSRL